MLRLPRCKVTTQDDIFPEIESGALVVVVGESPNATVKISAPDFDARKFRLVDRLTRAEFKRKGDTWTFTGTSDHLRNDIGSSDAKLSISATPAPGCEDCKR
jgi:hypothetical protein